MDNIILSQVKIKIFKMSCINCANSIKTYLLNQNSILDVNISFNQAIALIKFNLAQINETQIINLIKELGYDAEIINEKTNTYNQNHKNNINLKLIISLLFSLPVITINMFFYNIDLLLIIASILSLPVILYGGFEFHKKTFIIFIKRLPPTMDVLVSISSISSYFLSLFLYYYKKSHHVYFDSTVTIITAILIGKFIEEKIKSKYSSNFSNVFQNIPNECTLLKDSNQVEVSVLDVKLNDILILKPYSKIPVDCEILEGEGFVENSIITGESVPIFCKKGDILFAGALNFETIFKVKAISDGKSSYIKKIEQTLENVLNKKSHIQKIADEISKIFIPIVFIFAFITFISHYFKNDILNATINSISVIAIACPCALGLALPLAFYFGINKAINHGIIFTNSDSLYKLKEINTFVFDKTGTLTSNQLIVKDVIYYENNLNPTEILHIIASCEKYSNHPIATAILKYALNNKINPNAKVTNFKILAGLGIKANCNNKEVVIGNDELIKEHLKNINTNLDIDSYSINIYALIDNKLVAFFKLGEQINYSISNVLKEFKKQNINVYVLSGDNAKNVKNIALECGINEQNIFFSLKPDDKAEIIKKLKNSNLNCKIAMVGDGINDVLAMANADISIAVVNSTSITQSVADIILTTNNLENIILAFKIGIKLDQIIKQNFFWAFFYNIILIPIAMSGKLTPMYASMAMALSSLFVVINSTRIQK